MATSVTTANVDRVNQGLRIVREALTPIVYRELVAKYGQNWWLQGVMLGVSDAQRRALPEHGREGDLLNSLDVASILNLMERRWNEVFKQKFSRQDRSWINLLIDVRNETSHLGGSDLSDDQAWYALQTMVQLLERRDAPRAALVRDLAGQVRRDRQDEAPVPPPPPKPKPVATSPGQLAMGEIAWRDVVRPHDDVAQGRYQVAQFAADLSQVLAGRAAREYQDAGEFFARTYLTAGMSSLLTSAVRRLSDEGGDPVVQVKTAFGGGKTHSMLALYHLLHDGPRLEGLPYIQSIEQTAGVSAIPKANVAVLVGTALGVAERHLDSAGRGVEVSTLWGEMAAQLGGPAGYEFVKAADQAGTAPGSTALIKLFDAFAPCAVIIDELVAYARTVWGVRDLPSGSFDSIMTFIQNLTEAAIASKRTIVIAAIPESDIEAGGEAGEEALKRLGKTFERVEAVWQPVVAEEAFEVVRRRLFLPIEQEAAKEATCLAFSKLYGGTKGEFPKEATELAYLDRLRGSYPIHPELFRQLYEEWSTLESFQKTRGVLRLMAAVIPELWIKEDRSPMIMPGDLPMGERSVRDELLTYLAPQWNAIVDGDVDGPSSEPLRLDREKPLFGQNLAAQRCSRTIFLGSAPHTAGPHVRGIEDTRVRLGVARPGEPIGVYDDALRQLSDRLTYLFTADRRYWYDTHPNVVRQAEERAARFEEYEVDQEIDSRLREKERGGFAGVHYTSERNGAEVPDEQSARLAILGPKLAHVARATESAGLSAAQAILEKRGNAPRVYRNMLVFGAPDEKIISTLAAEVRRFLAWRWVLDSSDDLNLQQSDIRQAEESIKRANSTVKARLREAYCWLLIPAQTEQSKWEWEAIRLPAGEKPFAERASDKLEQNGSLITAWSPVHLKRELDRWLWPNADSLNVRKVWDSLCSFGFFSRLRDVEVFKSAIAQGVRSADYFGYASSVSSSGRYEGLMLDTQMSTIDVFLDSESVLVQRDIALAQKRHDEEERLERQRQLMGTVESQAASGDTREPVAPSIREGPAEQRAPAPALKRHFHASAQLDVAKAGSTVSQIQGEIVSWLASLPNAAVSLTLEIDVNVPNGVPDDTERVVSENSRTLRLEGAEFD